MLCRNICNQLLNQYGLTNTGTAEQTDFSTLLIRAEQVNDLDTSLQKLCLCGLLLEFRCRPVNRLISLCFRSWFVVYGFAKYVEHTSKCVLSDRNCNRCAGRYGIHPSYKSVSRTHGDTPYCIITQMLCNLDCQFRSIVSGDFDRFIDFGKLSLTELNIEYRTDNLGNFTNCLICHLFVSSLKYL